MGYETPRICRTFGGSTAEGRRDVELRARIPRGGPDSEDGDKLAGALDAGIPARGEEGPAATANAWAAAAPVEAAEEGPCEAAAEGSCCRRLRERVVDVAANRRPDSSALRGALPHGAHWEAAPWHGMELPEARAQSHSARRGSHRAVEATGLATDKKTRHDVAPTWSSSTRAGFWSFRMCIELGLPKAEHPWCATATVGIACRPFRRSASRLVVDALACASNSSRKTSRERRFSGSSATCCGSFVARLTCFGTAAPFTDDGWCRTSFTHIRESAPIASLPTRPNSTPMSLFGHESRHGSQTPRRETWTSLAIGSARPSSESRNRTPCFAPASTRPTFLGLGECLSIISW